MSLGERPANCTDVADTPESVVTTIWTEEEQFQQLVKRGSTRQYSFSPRPTDVIVANPPKSGTTWLTHICHQIRTKAAELDFEDQLSDVVTLLELNDTALPDISRNWRSKGLRGIRSLRNSMSIENVWTHSENCS